MKLPTVLREAAVIAAEHSPGFAIRSLADGAFDLWMAFKGPNEHATRREIVLGLLLLAEVIESAE